MSGGIDPIERRRVGRTALAVSRLGVGGGSSFGRAGEARDALLDLCWESGLRHFDTAPLYGKGESERIYGRALRHRPRDEFVLSTKVGRNGVDEYDYSGTGVERSLAGSLQRLGLDRIDIAQIHDLDPEKHGEQFESRFEQAVASGYPVLDAMRGAGAIGAIGIGLSSCDVALRFMRSCRLDCVMLAGGYTLLQHGALAEMLPWCLENQVSVMLAAPYNTGILATGAINGARYYYKPAPDAIMERTRRLEAVCVKHGVPLAAAALQFPLFHPAVASVVVGHESAGEVTRNLALLRHAIPGELWREMKLLGLLPQDAPVPQ